MPFIVRTTSGGLHVAKRRKASKLLQYLGLAVLAVVTLAAVVLALNKGNVSVDAAEFTPAPVTSTPTSAPEPTIPGELLEPGTNVVFFGDSWTAGYAADPGLGYAPVTAEHFGWDAAIEAKSGTGYLRDASDSAYPERAKDIPADENVQLVILQGGLNDTGEDLSDLPEAARETINTLGDKYPNAEMVILGPAPATLPVGNAIQDIDRILTSAATAAGVPYISPIDLEWITEGNFGAIIDTDALNHPGTAGHAHLAEELVKALKSVAE